RSERSGQGDGRIYTIVYSAVDCAGNSSRARALVRVPHDHAGWANCSTGFVSSGVGFDPALKQFVLVIRSRAEQYGEDENGDPLLVQPAFDATELDITRVYVGNTNGVTAPEKSLEVDNNNDGLLDLALYYSIESANLILGGRGEFGPTGANEPLGLHYVSPEGVDYLVPNIFELGTPVPLIPSIQLPRTSEGGSGDGEVPKVTALLRSYPNPFNPSTTIPFTLEKEGHVTLRIYDARGKLVRNLKDEVLPSGLHEVTWNGRDNSGLSVATGVYFVRFATGNYATTQKIVMIK
ncbi:MAG: FlgD immunoglobulin-like domain containing protein, partial [bacterium]